nr:leucine-rich repeat-containing protein 43 [Loxodonta africana]
MLTRVDLVTEGTQKHGRLLCSRKNQVRLWRRNTREEKNALPSLGFTPYPTKAPFDAPRDVPWAEKLSQCHTSPLPPYTNVTVIPNFQVSFPKGKETSQSCCRRFPSWIFKREPSWTPGSLPSVGCHSFPTVPEQEEGRALPSVLMLLVLGVTVRCPPQVLELYGNEITSVECLCAHPPPGLQHLGLGHNKLLGALESLYVTANHWPNLVSLDLGFNDLTDLQSMVDSLHTLRQLRLLVLQGNPLALVPYYRGLTVDTLSRLCVLDDITVSPNEKHQFRGLSINGDLLAHEAQLVVTIGNVRGVLDSSVLDPEPGPEGPFIAYSYYVTYDFVEDEEGGGSEYAGVLAEIVKPLSSTEILPEESPEEDIEEAEESVESGGMTESGELEGSVSVGGSAVLPRSVDSVEELAKLRPRIDPRLCPSPGTVLFSTVRKPWSDVIACDYEMQHTLRDLVPLKAFLLAGTTVTIVQEKILSWPLVAPPSESPSATKKGKPEKDKKGKDDKKGKGEKEASKEQKGPKKKKELPKELRQDPPILTVLGRGLVALESLLAGESLVSTVCNFGVVRTIESDKLTFARDLKKSKSKKAVKRDAKKTDVLPSEDNHQPEPLTVEVQIQLNQCRTAEEALKAFSI